MGVMTRPQSRHPHQRARATTPGTEDQAFGRLYSEHVDLVRRSVRRYLWGAVVDDVVQETFAQAYRSRLHVDSALESEGDEPVAKRLAGIARNRSIDVLRHRMRGLDEVPDDGRVVALASTSCDADPERRLLAGARREGIAEAFSSLRDVQRRLLFLRYVEGMSYAQIARAEDMSIDAVKANLARGRRTFRTLYAALAEARGLVVVAGTRFWARLRSHARRLRDRATAGASDTLSGLASATPAVGQAVVTAVVIGSVAILGTGRAAADEGGNPPPSAEEAPDDGERGAGADSDDGSSPADAADEETASPSGRDHADHGGGAEAGTHDNRSSSAPEPEPRREEASAGGEVDSEDVTGEGQPARAETAAKAEAAAGEKEASADGTHATDAEADTPDAEADAASSFEVGGLVKFCFDPNSPGAAACEALEGAPRP